ncbi:MAG: hypothetical protein ABI550_10110 [Ignavibacteriaceae bacterium]
MGEITYIFGAGASCQAMPLVSNFHSRFKTFQEFLSSKILFNQIENDCNEFASQIKSHLSFDTFFKKLFHQNKGREIQRFKGIMLVYFLFEQLFSYEDLLYDEEFIKKEGKEFILDPRYEALIAGLLKPIKGRIEFYKNVNFLTWNYDVNLLLSLKNFISPKKSAIEFIDETDKSTHFQINEQIKVFHLNGYIAHPVLNEIGNDEKVKAFEDFLKEYDTNKLERYINNIMFAWEQDIENFTALSEIIQNSEQVVCIGYSLPLFNRVFDTKYLNENNLRGGKELFIQNLEINSIRDILTTDLGVRLDVEELNVNFSMSCSSFLIPSNIFN